MVIATFFLFLAIDYSTRESIEPIKMLFLGVLGSLVIYYAYLPDSIVDSIWYGFPSLNWSGMLRILAGILIVFYGFLLCYFSLITYLKSPKALKSDALILLMGSLTVGLIGTIIHILTDIVIVVAFGVLLMAIAFMREPKIFYVLPFKANRLTVIHNKTGIPLYDYKWTEEHTESILLGGLLKAMSEMTLEILKRGDIEEMKLSHGILLFYQSKGITVGLLTSKTSKYLKECLEKFTNAFEQKFENELNATDKKYVEPNNYISSIELIERYFTHIPSRINDK
jgi:hypothetical protein